jgi:maleamate amidohydrolase
MSEQTANDNYQGVWGQRIGFGQKAALLMIDFMRGYRRRAAVRPRRGQRGGSKR